MKFDIISFSFILVLIPMYLSYRYKIGVEKELFKNSIRAFLQLSILGFVLGFLFDIKNFFYYIPIMIAMLFYSAYIAKKRTNFSFWYAFYSLFLSTVFVLFILVTLKIISLKPHVFIPITGMIIGNALNTYTLTLDRLDREIDLQMDLVEALVSVGASLKEAYEVMRNQAVKASMIPVNNMLETIGIVAIPGIATGMLIAGVDPLKAISYQIVIIYMIVSINLFTSLLGSWFFIKAKVKDSHITKLSSHIDLSI